VAINKPQWKKLLECPKADGEQAGEQRRNKRGNLKEIIARGEKTG